MKNIILFATLIMLLAGCSNSPKKELYVVHVHGDWCMTCETVDPVVHSLEGYFQNKEGVDYLVFDETNPESVKKSEKLAAQEGLEDLFEYERHTGEVLFVDKETKETLAVFAGVGDEEKYKSTVENLLAGKEVESLAKKPASYELSKPEVDEIKKAKLYVIDIHHDKCGTCSITVPTFEKVASQYKANDEVSFFTFDLSTPKTIDQTRSLAKRLGIEDIYNTHKHTGEVLFVDASTKKIKKSLVAETNVVKYNQVIDSILNHT